MNASTRKILGQRLAGGVLLNGWVAGGGYRYTREEIEGHLRESGLMGAG